MKINNLKQKGSKMKKIAIISFIFLGLLGNANAASNWTTQSFIEGYNLYSTLECNSGEPRFIQINNFDDLNYRCGAEPEFKFVNLN